MTPFDSMLAMPNYAIVVAVLIVSALAHGSLGFGFPVISTPVIAMITDIQTAILLTLFPNLAVNLISIFRGGNWSASLARYWPVALWVAIGTIIGTKVLILADPEPLKLLLAAMIVVFLLQARFRRLDWSWLKRHPRMSGLALGLLAGFLSGAVNVALPPLVIYFMAIGLDALPMTQILNLCFFVGRTMQAATLGISGKLGMTTLVATAPLTVLSVVVVLVGMRIQSRIHPEVYQRLLRKILWVMVVILVIQVVRHYSLSP